MDALFLLPEKEKGRMMIMRYSNAEVMEYVREEDAEQHKVAARIPNPMFFRVFTAEKHLDLLFMILVAMARSGATDERGGTRRMLWNTLKGAR